MNKLVSIHDSETLTNSMIEMHNEQVGINT